MQIWTIITRPRFDAWFARQSDAVQEEILAVLTLLREDGPNLGRPQIDTLNGSSYSNMKELRVQVGGHPVRACFAFDPRRRAIVLCAGDKKGEDEKRFYKRLIKTADTEYAKHLQSLEEE
nr:type II toxin-antitoxin system RelE/ParE family toxin [uncultured Erwinia sp.]